MLPTARRTSTFALTVLLAAGCAGAFAGAAQAAPFTPSIRLMPMGDSITAGYLSSTGNGYRGPLWSGLAGWSKALDFVGNDRDGDMQDPDNEGHSGYRIDQIAALVDASLAKYRPNIITLHLGTNDLNGGFEVDTAPARLAALIDQIFADAPDTTLLVATLVRAANDVTEARIAAYNPQVRAIVKARAQAGRHIQLVDMDTIALADLQDGLHPNDTGYAKMAKAWRRGIKKVIANGWVKAPQAVASLPGNGVHKLQPQNATGLALDNLADAVVEGNAIDVYTAQDGNHAQAWTLSDAGVTPAGAYKIVMGGNFCLATSSATEGALVKLQACSGAPGQSWTPVSTAVGFTLHPADNPGLCLDVQWGGTSAGTPVQVWGCDNTPSQQWLFY